MLYEAHRGVYEFLWSEHKYNVMAVSNVAFTSVATRLNRGIKVLSLLRKIGDCAFEERTENYRALLHAYTHVQEFLSRSAQEEIIKAVVADEALAACLIYKAALSHFERALPGCRYFFNPRHAANKFWDSQEKPGLWICLGAFQLQLPTNVVFSRICHANNLSHAELLSIFTALKNGLEIQALTALPTGLIKSLRDNNTVAEPGDKYAYLNPRIKLDLCTYSDKPLHSANDLTYLGFILEHLIDNSEYPPEFMGVCPDYELFVNYLENVNLTFIEKPAAFSLEAAFSSLSEAFAKRLELDKGSWQ